MNHLFVLVVNPVKSLTKLSGDSMLFTAQHSLVNHHFIVSSELSMSRNPAYGKFLILIREMIHTKTFERDDSIPMLTAGPFIGNSNQEYRL